MRITRNVGALDRTIRGFLGGLLVLLAVTGAIGAWGWLGLILLGTAFFSFCPAYRLVGFDTCDTRE